MNDWYEVTVVFELNGFWVTFDSDVYTDSGTRAIVKVSQSLFNVFADFSEGDIESVTAKLKE